MLAGGAIIAGGYVVDRVAVASREGGRTSCSTGGMLRSVGRVALWIPTVVQVVGMATLVAGAAMVADETDAAGLSTDSAAP
jgi:hypothetical protein